MVAKPKTIFRLTRKIVAAVRNIFSFEKTMVCGIEKMVCVIQTVFTTTWTTVAPAKKMVSASQTMVCEVLSIVLTYVRDANHLDSARSEFNGCADPNR
jgi:hypothetical protein